MAMETQIEVTEEGKRCLIYGEIKPYSDFYKRGNGSLKSDCKACTIKKSAKWIAARQEQEASARAARAGMLIRRCDRCQRLLRREKYSPDESDPQGCQAVCMECNSLFAHYADRVPKDDEDEIQDKVLELGEHLETHIVSILREMGGLQYIINETQDEHKKKVVEEMEHTEAVIGTAVRRLGVLYRLLRCLFSKRSNGQPYKSQSCKYGRVAYMDGLMRVTLQLQVAWDNKDKP